MTQPMKWTSVQLIKDRGELEHLVETLRQQFGYSHRDMAVLLGVHETTYWRYRKSGNWAGVVVLKVEQLFCSEHQNLAETTVDAGA
jgi:predicted transcriptional regulator